MKNIIKIISISAFLMGSSSVFSKEDINPYVDCGIGAAVFSESKGGAVISNITFDFGTTAITSATLSPELCDGKTKEVAKYIFDSYDSLAEDLARGNGEHLTALLNILEH